MLCSTRCHSGGNLSMPEHGDLLQLRRSGPAVTGSYKMMSRFAHNDLFPQATMDVSPPTSEAGPSTTLQRQDSATAAIAAVLDDPIPDVQPNENTPAPAAPAPRRAYNRKPKTGERTMAYTSAFVPGM